jgi:hypothetical protein
MRSRAHQISTRKRLALIVTLLLSACGMPSKEKVSQDFYQIFTKEVGASIRPAITSIGSGEGDADNVYQYIKFDVTAEENISLKKGWLAGTSLNKGQRLYNGEVVVLYQRTGKSAWTIANYELTRAPGNAP